MNWKWYIFVFLFFFLVFTVLRAEILKPDYLTYCRTVYGDKAVYYQQFMGVVNYDPVYSDYCLPKSGDLVRKAGINKNDFEALCFPHKGWIRIELDFWNLGVWHAECKGSK